jgi:hypothetical protein
MDQPGDDDASPRSVAPRGDGPKLEVNGVQVCASALAAVTAAVIGSFFGVTGTIAGAGMASLFATFGSAVYSHFLRTGSERLQQVEVPVLASTLGRVTSVTTTRTVTSPAPRHAGADHGKNGGDDDTPGEPPAWRRRLAQRRGVVAAIAVVFVLAMAIVTGIELVTQRPLAGVAGGDSSGLTSIGKALPGSPDDGGPGPSTTTTTGEGSGATTTVTDDAEPAPSPEGDVTTTTTAADDSAGDGGDGGDGFSEPTTSTTASTSTTAPTTSTPEPPSRNVVQIPS